MPASYFRQRRQGAAAARVEFHAGEALRAPASRDKNNRVLGGTWQGGVQLVILIPASSADMRFVQNFTPPDFQAKYFTPSILHNFNSYSDKNTKN